MALDYKSPEATELLSDNTTSPNDLHDMALQFTTSTENHDNVDRLVQHPNLSPETISHLANHFDNVQATRKPIFVEDYSKQATTAAPMQQQVSLMGHPKIQTHQARKFIDSNLDHVDDSGHWDQVVSRAKYSPEEKEQMADKHIRDSISINKKPQQGFDNPPEFFLNHADKLNDEEVFGSQHMRDHHQPYIEKQLINNKHHNEQTLDQTIDVLNGDDRGLGKLARMQSDKLSSKHIDKILESSDDEEEVYHRVISLKLPNLSQETLVSAVNHPNSDIADNALESTQLKTETIDRLWESETVSKGKLLGNPNISEDKQIEAATKYVSSLDMESARVLNNPNISPKAVEIIMSGKITKDLAIDKWKATSTPPMNAVPYIIDSLETEQQARFVNGIVSNDQYTDVISEGFDKLGSLAKERALQQGSPELSAKHFMSYAAENPRGAMRSGGFNHVTKEEKESIIPKLVNQTLEILDPDMVHEASACFLESPYITLDQKQGLVDHLNDRATHKEYSQNMVKAINQNITPTHVQDSPADLIGTIGTHKIQEITNVDFLHKALKDKDNLSSTVVKSIFTNPNLPRKSVIDNIGTIWGLNSVTDTHVLTKLLHPSFDTPDSSSLDGLDVINKVIKGEIVDGGGDSLAAKLHRNGQMGSLANISSTVMASQLPLEAKVSHLKMILQKDAFKSFLPVPKTWPKEIKDGYLNGDFKDYPLFEQDRETSSGVFSSLKESDIPALKNYFDRTQAVASAIHLKPEILANPEIYHTIAKTDIQTGLRGLKDDLIKSAADYHSANWNKHLDFIKQYGETPDDPAFSEEHIAAQTGIWIQGQGAGLRKWQQAIDDIDYTPVVDQLMKYPNHDNSRALRTLQEFDLVTPAKHEELCYNKPEYALHTASRFGLSDNAGMSQIWVSEHLRRGSLTPEQVLDTIHEDVNYDESHNSLVHSLSGLTNQTPEARAELLTKLAQSNAPKIQKSDFFKMMIRYVPKNEYLPLVFRPEIGDQLSDEFISYNFPDFAGGLNKVPEAQAYIKNRIDNMPEELQLRCLKQMAATDPKAMQHLIDREPANPSTHKILLRSLFNKEKLDPQDITNLQKLTNAVKDGYGSDSEVVESVKNLFYDALPPQLDEAGADKFLTLMENSVVAADGHLLALEIADKLYADDPKNLNNSELGARFLNLGVAKSMNYGYLAIQMLPKNMEHFDNVVNQLRENANTADRQANLANSWELGQILRKGGTIPDVVWEKAFGDSQYSDIQKGLVSRPHEPFPKDDFLKNKIVDTVMAGNVDDIPQEYAEERPDAYIAKAISEGRVGALLGRATSAPAPFVNKVIDNFPAIASQWEELHGEDSEEAFGAMEQAHHFIRHNPKRWREVVDVLNSSFNQYEGDEQLIQSLITSLNPYYPAKYDLTEKDAEDLVALNSNALMYSKSTPIKSFKAHFPFDKFTDDLDYKNPRPDNLSDLFDQVSDWHQHSDLVDKYMDILKTNESLYDIDSRETFLPIAKKFSADKRESLIDWFDANEVNLGDCRDLVMNQVGGSRAVDRFFETQDPRALVNLLGNYDELCNNPYIKLRHLKKIIDDKDEGLGSGQSFTDLVQKLAPIFDEESTDYLLNKVDWDNVKRSHAQAYLGLPHIDKGHFDQCFAVGDEDYPKHFLPSSTFNSGYLNPKFGHKKLLEIKPSTPDDFAETVNQEALPSRFQTLKSKDGVKHLQAMLPHIGEAVDYKTLKNINPAFDKMPEVKALFQKKHRVTPEDVANRIEELSQDGYFLTYSKWSGAQRHMGDRESNLVVQLNTSEKIREELAQDPRRLAFYNFINAAATRIHPNNPNVGGHPNTPHIVSWVRVDTRDPKKWVVEEFQSDFASSLVKEIHSVKSKGHKSLTDENTGNEFSIEEMERHAKDIERILGDWGNSSLSGMEDFAKAQGAEELFIHGVGLRAKLSGLGDTDEGSSKLEELYYKNPKKHNYEEIDYKNYPSVNKNFEGDSMKYKGKAIPNKCWRKKLT